jgi:flavin-dependent dehydrogenase
MRRSVDLAIVGGGPAGLAAGIRAARAGLDVVVFEPKAPGPIDKACGEGIMPGGVAALRELGIVPDGVPFRGVRYSDAVDPALFAEGTFSRGPGLGVRRTVLHGALREAARGAGVRFDERRITELGVRAADHVGVGDLRARWLIAADGLRSTIRGRLGLGLPPRRPSRLGVRRHYRRSPWSDRVEVYFANGVDAYVTPVSRDLVDVAFLFSGSSPEGFDALLRRFPLLLARLPSIHATTVRGAGPFEQRVARRVVGNVLLIGDAAGYLDPATGEGVALGLATARAAVDCILRNDVGAYEAEYRRLTRTYFALTAGLLRVTRHRVLHRPLLVVARRLPQVFDLVLDRLAALAPVSPGHAIDSPSLVRETFDERSEILQRGGILVRE